MKTSEREEHAARLRRDGYTIIPDVMSGEEIEASRRAIDECLDAEAEIARKHGLQNDNLLMCYNVQGKHPYFRGMLLRNPEPAEVARLLLGQDMFAHNVAIRKPMPTGKKDWARLGGHLHADWDDFTVKPFLGGRHYPMAVQSAWCVSEFTAQNGATYVWPGSHLNPDIPPEQPETLPSGWVRAEAPAGSAILWDSAIWHTSGVNAGDAPRYSLVFYFQRWWIKGFNDAYRLISPQVREAMTPEERRIWGLEAAVPPNTHFRNMTPEQIAALTREEKAALNVASF